MRKQLFIFLLATLHLCLWATTVNAQKKEALPAIYAVFKQAPIFEILTELERQSGYRFYFDQAHIDSMKADLLPSPASGEGLG